MLTTILTGVQFFLFILVVFTVLFWLIPQKYQWVSFLVTVILFAYMAYMIVPDTSDDLDLYFWHIDVMRSGGKKAFDSFVEGNNFDWQTYRVSGYFMYFISKLKNNHFMPAIIIFCCYGSSLFVINDASKRFDVDKFHTYLGTMFYLSTYWFFDVCSGIRNGFAFTTAFAAAYFHIVVKKYRPICFLAYFNATFFHSAGFMPLIIVLLTFITLKIPGKFINVALIFSVFIGSSLFSYLSKIYDNGFIQTAAEKSNHYGNNYKLGENMLGDTNTMYKVTIVTGVIVFLLLIFVLNYFRNSEEAETLFRFEKLSSSTFYFAIGAIPVGLIFVRVIRWMIPIIGAVLFMVGMQYQKNEIDKKGVSEALYYSDNIKRFKYKARPIIITLWIVFVAVHIWYDVNGSSLIWAHFEHEWIEAGYPYTW